jgi:hypothetical protein
MYPDDVDASLTAWRRVASQRGGGGGGGEGEGRGANPAVLA